MFHGLLLVAAPGKFQFGSGGASRLSGESSQGKLLVQLHQPSARFVSKQVEITDPAAVIAQSGESPTPEVREPLHTEDNLNDASAVNVKRGDSVVPAPSPLLDEHTNPGLPLLPPDHYFKSSELDVPPQVKTAPVFDYPQLAVANRASGKVVVDVRIGEDGQVEGVTVIRAVPPGMFEEAAIEGWRRALFTPGVKTNAAVKSRLTLEMSFDASQENRDARSPRPEY